MLNGLFGISHSNRTADDHWGKNCFNSSFPAATANYMFARNVSAIYIKLDEVDGQLKVISSTIPIKDVFNSGTRSLDDLYFSIESVYQPYQQYSFDAVDGIDLVIKDIDGNFLSPL